MRRLLGIAIVLMAACSARSGEDKDVISNQVGDWDGSLSQVANSGVRGSARAQSLAVGTGVNVSIQGAQSGAQHPWHVHSGVCGDNGAIVGSAGAYPVLAVATDGTASANATIDVPLKEDESYYVNIHKSATELATIVACGAITND